MRRSAFAAASRGRWCQTPVVVSCRAAFGKKVITSRLRLLAAGLCAVLRLRGAANAVA